MDMPPKANNEIDYSEMKEDQEARQTQISLDNSMSKLANITPGENPYKREAVINEARRLRHEAQKALAEAKSGGTKLTAEEEQEFFNNYWEFIRTYANNVDAYEIPNGDIGANK